LSNITSRDNGNRTKYLRKFFTERLQHLVTVRRERGNELEAGDSYLRLLDKAVYSTYCDCLDLGLSGEARAILHQSEHGKSPKIDPVPEQN
jgi:3-dehydroquinate dehydratase